MTKSLVPVVFATDDIFAPYCGVSIASLIDNCDKQRSYAVYVFYDDLSEENVKKLSSMAVDNVSVECINITEYIDRKLLYTHKRLTVATYYRFFVAEVLPQYDKLLYLDSDIAILRDVGELYDIDIGDNLLGGIVIYRGEDSERELKEEYLKALMDTTPDRYVNAGILSMNLKGMREQGIKDKCLAFIGDHRDLRWLDQDVLNAVCKGQIAYLPEEWNLSQFYFERDFREGKDVSRVGIVHYLNSAKPWLIPYKVSHLYFYQYAPFTPYAQQLRAIFLENNKRTVTDVRGEMLKMAAMGEVGPRYFSRCLVRWFKAKVRMITGKKE